MPRFRCNITRRTFSVLPDGLLPYCSLRTALVLSLLDALYLQGAALNTLARTRGVARGVLRSLKARFQRVVSVLRLPAQAGLPECEGAFGAGAFLDALCRKERSSLTALFRSWKEQEPKHSVVGIYAR